MKKIIIKLIYILACIFYDKKYMSSSFFKKKRGIKLFFQSLFFQKILRINSNIPFPVSSSIRISSIENLEFDKEDIGNFSTYGCYFQNFNAQIKIGSGTYIAPNVGLITSNHNKKNLSLHEKGEDIQIGKNCWIGMNTVILPGVILKNNTIVGAGSVVTKSFLEENIVIGGNPAKIIKKLNLEEK